MKRLLLLGLIIILGCLDVSSEECPVSQYLDQGVAVTYLKTDFETIIAGNPVTLIVDVNNLGESIGTNVVGEVIGPDNYYIIDFDENNDKDDDTGFVLDDTMYPPDPEKCLEGSAETESIQLTSRSGKQTPVGGVPIKFRIRYDYTSQSWADILAMSKDRWSMAVKAGNIPDPYTWQSAGPVKIDIIVPDSPIVPDPSVDDTEKPIRIRLDYVLGGETKAITDANDASGELDPMKLNICAFPEWRSAGKYVPNCIDSLKIELADGLEFVRSTRAYCGGALGFQYCNELYDADNKGITLAPALVTTDSSRPEEYVLWVKVTDDVLVEETYKITATAKYRMEVVYETDPVYISIIR